MDSFSHGCCVMYMDEFFLWGNLVHCKGMKCLAIKQPRNVKFGIKSALFRYGCLILMFRSGIKTKLCAICAMRSVNEVFIFGFDMQDVLEHLPNELGESQDFAECDLGT